MFEAAKMMFIYVETALHAGTGRALGTVDLPIQRERVTGYPMVQASSVKGKLRAVSRATLDNSTWSAIFGPERIDDPNAAFAGALAPGDARILLFPVRSLAGVFAWATCPDVLARLLRDYAALKLPLPNWQAPSVSRNVAMVSGDSLMLNNTIVLDDFTFTPKQDTAVATIATWLAENAFPTTDEYVYWKSSLSGRLVILDNESFRDFTQFATEVQTHIRIDDAKKTVEKGALWTEESLPADTLLYAPLCAMPSRNGIRLSGAEVLTKVAGLGIKRMQLGGDETTGRGYVSVRI